MNYYTHSGEYLNTKLQNNRLLSARANKWLIVILFLAVIFIDGVILPGFLGFRESFLTIIFLVAMLLYYKMDSWSLVIGIVLSGLAEFYWGLKLGTLMISFLASAGAFFILNKFFNVRSAFFMVISGIVIFVIFWETSILATKLL